MRPKTCPFCRERYTPTRPMQPCCDSFECKSAFMVAHIAKARKKRTADDRKQAATERKAVKTRLLEMKPKAYWVQRAKLQFHRWVRARDEGRTCISCDKILRNTGKPGGDYDAGHFRSVGSAKHLEFDERNVHGQCKHCNDKLKGNPLGYEAGLIVRYGPAMVDALKADQTSRHLTIADYQQIESTYKRKLTNRDFSISFP